VGIVCGLAGCSSGSAPPPPRTPEAPVATPAVETPPPAPAAKPRDYPATRRADVIEQRHGVEIRDPYRWLEDASKPEVQDWMKAQDAYARERIARLPGHDVLAARLAQVFYYDAISAPRHRGDRYFYTHKHKDKEKAILYWKQGERGTAKVLLDPNTWSTDGSAGLKGWWPSADGRYLAFSKSEHNADETATSIIDVASGKLLPDVLTGTKYGQASWMPDGRGFYYVYVPPQSDQISVAERPGFTEMRYHALGTDQAKDPVVREATRNPQTFLRGVASRDGHWLFAEIQHGWTSSDIYFKDLRTKQKGWRVLVEGVKANFDLDDFRDVFYVRTDEGAPRYRVFAVDPKRPARASWKEIVPQGEGTLEGVTLIGGRMLLSYLRNAASELELRDLQGKRIGPVDLPPLGTIDGVAGLPTDDTAYVAYTSFTVPQSIYKISARTGEATTWARVELPVDTSQFTTEQVRFPSKDGTEITMFLLHRKDTVKNGKNPTFLTGYGGFGLSALPGFVSSRSSWAAHAVWLEHGGMVAVPNLRGGGEYGEDWHKSGMMLAKQHVFDDFIGAARWLIESGWTSRDHLAISGGSNGGLLMGAAVTQAPELFKAVVCEVPLLDMVRYHLFGSGRTWVPEYGSAEDAAQFAAIHAYSPYHHVKQGASYPAFLMSSSDHDDRVDPMHARKFTALLQWANRADTPVWLRIQTNAGHSGADQVRQKVEQNADTYAFLMWQLGMKPR
jgi:prolyl oligopeptidase